jgi:DNA excision repair protein ERCC-4
MTATLDNNELGTLPALKKLGKLADLRPVIAVDSREQQALTFTRLESVVATLQSADYSFLGAEERFAVSRKSLPDLVSSCVGENRARTERHLHRLRGYHFARLLIIGNRWEIEAHRYRSAIKPSVILHSLAAWEVRYNVPVVWVERPEQAAALVESWAWWFAREMVETANTLLRGTKAAAQPEAIATP